jgi:hypothetical protein
LCKVLRNVGLILHIHKTSAKKISSVATLFPSHFKIFVARPRLARPWYWGYWLLRIGDTTRRLSDCASIGSMAPVPGKRR